MTNASSAPPTWLAADFRYAGDDWAGANALTYVVYQTAPVYASDGVTIVTPGVPRSLAGCSVTGSLRYQVRCPLPQQGISVGAPIAMTGAIVDSDGGVISLSLPAAQTVFARQGLEAFGDPRRALLVAQPKVVDADANAVTVGLQPLFVF